MPGLRRAQLRLEDINRLLSRASPEALPLMALPTIWLWNIAQDGHAAAHCIEACLVLHFALAEYGLDSDVQAVGLEITADNAHGLYDHALITTPMARSTGTRSSSCPPRAGSWTQPSSSSARCLLR